MLDIYCSERESPEEGGGERGSVQLEFAKSGR
jgi:hypothetical protein